MKSLSLRAALWLAACLIVATGAPSAQAENWPQWRGPSQNGVSQEQGLPTTWSKTENVLWRLPLPGPGGATPAVWGDSIFITAVEDRDLVLMCIGTDGKERWKRVVSQGNKDVRGDEGNSASPSPSTDGQHVWVFFANGYLACYDFAGEKVWGFNIEERYGKLRIAFGMTSTPVLDGERLYLQLIHGEGKADTREAKVVALDKKTGEEIWQVERPSEAYSENEHSYASPIIYRDADQAFLLTHGADYIVAHDLADGHELWRCGGLHPPTYDPTLRFVASPAAVPGLIVVPSAKRGVTLALKPGGKGEITEMETFRWWRYDTTPDVPSPLIVGDIVYLCRQNGNLIALDRATGKEFYEERTHADRHRASPVYADGKIFLTARDGTVSVCKPGPEFELLAQNEIDEPQSASPAIANGRIYLRTFEALYAIGK
ncbi:outer membrane protein assembly factor BamB family protein [Lignipirellula cremea]|uniref:Outer membrane biogenesis protein BamB n=1 Tax=Lignipirellula cremea TaxID=2528010 RepID=A0A518DZH4_9BACT|nr:PQQ-binding-like beta-propeller repeat protein [Lignipirellula cremea]QDU97238.1 outer membrane biogenesis protein BamB [Lignipirellula cremea]